LSAPARSTERGAKSWQQRYLSKYSVWGRVSRATVAELRQTIELADSERPVQAFLQRHPEVFAATLLRGHTRYVRPQVRLGSEYVPDFLLADMSSMGVHWTLVELESPTACMAIQSGDFAQEARNALHQITCWRGWLERNAGYARHTEPRGLGLIGITASAPGLIIVGRRGHDACDDEDWLRARTLAERNIQIQTYDWLVDLVEAEAR
jgi:hypothetical protein